MAQISRLKDAEISSGNLIYADDIDDEFDQLVNESNDQDLRLTDLESEDMTIAGVKTFTSAPKTNQIDERTAASGVTVDSVLLKDGMVTVAGTPTSAGMIGYASNLLKYHNGTSVITVGQVISAVETRSSNTIFAAADDKKVILFSSTFTQTFTAAATLGSGWFINLRNDSTGVITLDPNSSETIDGLTTMKMYPGEAFLVVCDGSNFKTVGRQKGPIPLATLTASNSSSIDFTTMIDDGFDHYFVRGVNITPDTNSVMLRARVSTSATFQTGSDYLAAGVNPNSSGGTGAHSAAAAAFFNVSNSSDGLTTTANWGGVYMLFNLFYPSGTSHYKHCLWECSNKRTTDGILTYATVSGTYQGSASAIDGLRFYMSSGNIASGTFTLYGVRS